MNPMTGEPVSVSPLTWSHSTFVATAACFVPKGSSVKRSAQTTNARRRADKSGG